MYPNFSIIEETKTAESSANDPTSKLALAITIETFTEEVKKSGVTTSPGEKHGDTACAACVGDPLIEPRGGIYALNSG